MPAKKGKQPDAKFRLSLTLKERECLVQAAKLTLELKAKIEETSVDQKFLEFTKSELEKLEDEVDNSLYYGPDAHVKRLNTILGKVGGILADLDAKELREKRQTVSKSGAIYSIEDYPQGDQPAGLAPDSSA